MRAEEVKESGPQSAPAERLACAFARVARELTFLYSASSIF